MKNSIKISIVAVALMFGACNSSSSFRGIDTTRVAKGAVYYQHEMHPDKIRDATSTYPVCGDDLINTQSKSSILTW